MTAAAKRPHQAGTVQEAIDLLADCTLVEYEGYRKLIADEWHMRAFVLDDMVAAKRKEKAKRRKTNGKTNGANVPAADGAALLDSVYAFLGRFVAYPAEDAHIAHVLWIAHAHLMASWESTPRIAFLSPEPASGKTRALEATELLVPLPVEAINVTPAYLFRKVGDEAGAPTILFDEVDTIFGPRAKNDNEEIRGLLNAGHRRGAVAGRCVVKGKIIETEEIPAYCAVALAGLGDLPDTLLSRAVIVRMRRRAPSEQIEPYRRRVHAPAGHNLRDRLAAWAGAVVEAATLALPDMPAGVEDRNADMWEPLLAVADLAGGGWPERARVSCVSHVSDSMRGTPSLGIRLLSDLRTIFGEQEALSTNHILEALHQIEDAPWADLKGKPLSSRGLSYMLKKYGVVRKQVRVVDWNGKGYAREDLHDAWQRYVPLGTPPIESETSETSVTPEADSDGELRWEH
jgi:hypothetical protein